MNMLKSIAQSAALLAMLIASAAACAQTTYRWQDASGKTVFSDQPPPPGAKALARIGAGAPADTPQLPYATRQAAEKYPVALYTAASCGELCDRARAYLNERAVPYAEKVLASDEQNAELERILGGSATVPSILVGRQSVKGFEAGAWESLLDLAGYPKPALRSANKTASNRTR